MKQEREERGGEKEGRNENERERGRKEMKEREKVKNPSANARDARNLGSIPALGKSPGEGSGSPL